MEFQNLIPSPLESLTEDEYLTGPPRHKDDDTDDDDNDGDNNDDNDDGSDASSIDTYPASLTDEHNGINEDDDASEKQAQAQAQHKRNEETQKERKSKQKKTKKNLDTTLYADEFIAEVDRHYNRVACSALGVWITLVSISFYIGKQKNALEKLTGIEQKAPLIASLLLGMSLVSSLLPLLVRENKRCMSGVVVCAVVVQFIAFSTDLLLAFLPTPVLIDPICGSKAYLLRYCEWTPLAFTMAFLTESCRIDDPSKRASGGSAPAKLSIILGAMAMSKEKGDATAKFNGLDQSEHGKDLKQRVQKMLNSAYYLGLSQGLSTFCGWVFPLCPGPISWCTCMAISCALFSVLWSRLILRSRAFQAMEVGQTLSENENYNWTRLSLGLLRTCTYVWSMLVVVFFLCAVGPNIFPNNRVLNTPGLSMMLESTLDVVFKAIYLLIVIDVHDTIFDPIARAERRLEELRQMLSVVWDNSSDVIGISVRSAMGDVTTMLSPTYMKIYSDMHNVDTDGPGSTKSWRALAFQLNASSLNGDRTPTPSNVFNMDMRGLNSGKRHEAWAESSTLSKVELVSMARLVVKAWKTDPNDKRTLLMHDLARARKPVTNIRCEANITRLEENALVIVVRDISERFRRFEAEKKVISETTARLKDAAANRFTRHEVKNGLLSAIALCDSLQESVNDLSAMVASLGQQVVEKEKALARLCNSNINGISDETEPNSDQEMMQEVCPKKDTAQRRNSGESSTHRFLFELDKTLYEILDTILAEAMARDVIHEIYELNLERVNVPQLLSGSININPSTSSSTRFPINTKPAPLPDFALDKQLLKYIHRNAISNSCKYGKKGGLVATDVSWDKKKGELRMDVTNLPGENHFEILKLGELAKEVVFSPRRRLAMHCTGDDNNQVSSRHSSGDGAWIMHKCAKTLGGKCSIQFKEDKTIFSFSCPVRTYEEEFASHKEKYMDFQLPKNVHAIAIDDSKIQRKLLKLFFVSAGVPEDRIHIYGGTAEEINTFCDFTTKFVDEHPDDFILMIVDENLDIQEELVGTKQSCVSGSGAVAEMRRRLLPDQERQVLALIRSANDSASDVSIYTSRAHGYLPKAPVKKNQVLEVLAPLWLERFPRFVPRTRDWSDQKSFDDVVVSMDDLMGLIADIDVLALLQTDELAIKWPIVWEKMHALKGDLQILPNRNKNLNAAITLISKMRGPKPPKDFSTSWHTIRSDLLNI